MATFRSNRVMADAMPRETVASTNENPRHTNQAVRLFS